MKKHLFIILFGALACAQPASAMHRNYNQIVNRIGLLAEQLSIAIQMNNQLNNAENILTEVQNNLNIDKYKFVNQILPGTYFAQKQITPLYLAVMQQNIPMIKLLLTYGANPYLQIAGGETPVTLAHKMGNTNQMGCQIYGILTNETHPEEQRRTRNYFAQLRQEFNEGPTGKKDGDNTSRQLNF